MIWRMGHNSARVDIINREGYTVSEQWRGIYLEVIMMKMEEIDEYDKCSKVSTNCADG